MINILNLSTNELKQLKQLEQKHLEATGNSYTLIYDDELDSDNVFVSILEDEVHPISALVVCLYEDYTELRGITHPIYRDKGYFSQLLEECDMLDGDLPIIYTIDQSMDSSRHMLLYSDYLLEITPSTRNTTNIPAGFTLSTFDGKTWIFYKDGLMMGSIAIEEGAQRNCIYDVVILEKYRGNGYSKILLELILASLPQEKPVILHVTSDNEPACKTYFNCGFYILESIDYYLL